MPNITDIIKNTKEINMSSTMLNQLLDFERVLDNLNLYAFANWINGELVEGPLVEKYWVTCKFMWAKKNMPDPSGAEKLLNYGCLVSYQKSKIRTPVKVKSPDDFEQGTRYPKVTDQPIWIVEIVMPKKLMADIKRGSVDVEGENIDLADLEKAEEDDLDQESLETQGTEQPGAPNVPTA